jgi:hypothetical protein
MIRKMFMMAGIALLCAGTAAAQEKMEQKESGLASWLKSMKSKLDIVNPRKSLTLTTGVAGVRGAREDNGKGKLYWKGKQSEERVTEEELDAFRQCVACAESGDRADAAQKLEEFMKQYPDSALIPDAKKTLDLVKAEATGREAKAEQKAGVPAGMDGPQAEPKTDAGTGPATAPMGQKAETK